MKETFFSGAPALCTPVNVEADRLLNLIDCRLRRKEVAHAEEVAEELLAKSMYLLLYQRAARMHKLNRVLLVIMKLLLFVVSASLVFMVRNIQPLLWLKIFASGAVMIVLLIVLNYYLFGRFYRAVHVMTETYRKENRRFRDLLLDSVRVNNDPESALQMFRLSMMR
jgi:hypothetical protein